MLCLIKNRARSGLEFARLEDRHGPNLNHFWPDTMEKEADRGGKEGVMIKFEIRITSKLGGEGVLLLFLLELFAGGLDLGFDEFAAFFAFNGKLALEFYDA